MINDQFSKGARLILAMAAAVGTAALVTFALPLPVQAQGGGLHPSSVTGRTGGARPDGAPLGASAWTGAAPYPTTIVRYAFAQVGEDLYVISGVSDGTRVATVRKYNTGTNIWSPLANIPLASEAPVAATDGSRIYVADGDTGNLIRIYDIAGNSWSAGPARPGVSSGYGAAAGVFNGKVYVVGGNASPITTTSIYDIAGNSWSAGTAAPAGYFLGGYTQVERYLYLVGSFGAGSTNSTTTMRLNMSDGTWTTGPTFTPQRADFALAQFGSKLYAIGGDTNGGGFFDSSNLVSELEITTWPAGTWKSAPTNLPSARQANQAGFATAGRSGGEMWSTGGITASFTFLPDHLYISRPSTTFTAALGSGSAGYPSNSGTQTGRLNRFNPNSTCAVPKTNPGVFDPTGARTYDSYRINNTTPVLQCVIVTIDALACTGTQFLFPVAYLNNFNPTNVEQNYLADSGGSPNPVGSFSFLLAAGQSAELVVHEVNPGAGCPAYKVTVNGLPWNVPYDTNHDYRTDRTVFRPSTGVWYTALSNGGATATPWGVSTDIDVMGDYDGDGKDDIAVWRPSNGTWYIVQSSNGGVRAQAWGMSGDIPIAADVEGDGIDDLVIYRNGSWFAFESSGGTEFLGWGLATDQPVLADFDGDGIADPGVFRPSNGFWYIYGSTGTVIVYGWGQSGDIPVPGNFDGDGKADIAVFRPSTGTWFVSKSSGGSTTQVWGGPGDIPVISDMDGDGRTDFTVWRPSTATWYTLYATGGSAFVPWGASTDRPTGRRPGS